MKVRVLFFAALREKMGTSEGNYEVTSEDTPSTLALRLLGFNSSLMFAVNDELVPSSHALSDGDCVAFIPPLAGG